MRTVEVTIVATVEVDVSHRSNYPPSLFTADMTDDDVAVAMAKFDMDQDDPGLMLEIASLAVVSGKIKDSES